jgi:MraZ protein
MLLGSYPAKIDEKSRLRLPAKFRRDLPETVDGTYYVTSLDGTRAKIYPIPVWERLVQKLQETPGMGSAKLKLQDITSYYGALSEMDPQGRILIPVDLREDAQLSGDVLVIGKPDHLEVVNKQALSKTVKENPLVLEEREKMADIGWY